MNTRIKQLRIEKHFTQAFLASQIGATQAALSKIECGISIPDAILLVNLSDIFQVSTDYILYLSDHRFSADTLLSDHIRSMQGYNAYISSLQKFSSSQRRHLQNFLNSIIAADDHSS